MAATDLPELNNELARAFRLRDQLPPLDLVPSLLPVVLVNPVQVSLDAGPNDPAFRREDHVSSRVTGPQAAGFVYLNTGPLPGGLYDVTTHLSGDFQQIQSTDQGGELARFLGTTVLMHHYRLGRLNGSFDKVFLQFALELEDQEQILLSFRQAIILNEVIFTEFWFRRRS